LLILLSTITLTACDLSHNNDLFIENNIMKQTLTIQLVQRMTGNHIRLVERILQFDAEHPDIEINIRSHSNNPDAYWFESNESQGTPPDIIEMSPNQLKIWFHHDKIEPLDLLEQQFHDYTITSPDGYVIGLKSKVNPLIVYYNKNTFARLGLEDPSSDWDWNMLEDIIAVLKSADEEVYIVLNPILLEWVAMNGYGSRIVDPGGTVFSGYMDSEQTIQAAEWLSWVDSDPNIYNIPYSLVEDQIVFGVDFAFDLTSGSISSFEAIIQRNDRIEIAPLPGGPDRVNIAKMTGLGVLSSSPNKEAAMNLIRFLIERSDDFYIDTIQHTYQNFGGIVPIDSRRLSIVKEEVQRSIPASLYMYDGQLHGRSLIHYKPSSAIRSGQSVKEVFRKEAESIDMQFKLMREDLHHLEECMKKTIGVCYFY